MKTLKTKILSIVVFVIIGLTSCYSQTKTETFGVRGNCGMCKNTIEKAAKKVKGVSKVKWDKASKEVEVTFDSSKTNLDAIHQAIAASGYDTDKVTSKEATYNSLHKCCQYDRTMEMSLKDGKKHKSTH